MSLFLQSNTGLDDEASWGSGDADLALLVINIAGPGAVIAPAILSTSRRSICYVLEATVTDCTVELPAIDATLPQTWRITVAGVDGQRLIVEPAGADGIVNAASGTVFVNADVDVPTSVTLMHDLDALWACYLGGATTEAPPSVAWRSFGKIALVNTAAGTPPTLYDPNSILTGAPTYAADGTVTWPMGTGQTRSLPSDGAMLVLPAPNVLGDTPGAYAWLWAIVRAELMSGRYTSAPILYGACLMDNPDPTLARGYGVRGGIRSATVNSSAGSAWALTPGAWVGSEAGGSNGTAAVEMTAARRLSAETLPVYGPCNGAGMASAGGSAVVLNLSALDFSSGCWLGLWVGTSATNLTPGNYGTRGLAAITDVDPADFEGVA